jgi:hypothetical protein
MWPPNRSMTSAQACCLSEILEIQLPGEEDEFDKVTSLHGEPTPLGQFSAARSAGPGSTCSPGPGDRGPRRSPNQSLRAMPLILALTKAALPA